MGSRQLKFVIQFRMSEKETIQIVQKLKNMYEQLRRRYEQEADQIENIDELYTKFRHLKLYQIEYDKHQELKKELNFWNNPNAQLKTQRQLELETELHRSLQQNAYLKSQLNALIPGYESNNNK